MKVIARLMADSPGAAPSNRRLLGLGRGGLCGAGSALPPGTIVGCNRAPLSDHFRIGLPVANIRTSSLSAVGRRRPTAALMSECRRDRSSGGIVAHRWSW